LLPAGEVFPIHGTCLGFQLLHILESNISFTRLLVDTDAVAHATTLDLTPHAADSAMLAGMDKASALLRCRGSGPGLAVG
jgi:gamma-glutamyl hydrolase